jgi:heme A synthase
MLFQLLIFVIVIGVIYWVLGTLPIPEPPRTIIYVILAIIFILALLGFIGVVPSLF